MTTGSVTTIGSLTSLGLLAPQGLAIAMEGVDLLSPMDQFDLARVFKPLVGDFPGVSLPRGKSHGRLVLEKWRATAQQLKNVPADRFFAAVEKSYAQGAAWLFDLEDQEETGSARWLYEKHRPQLEDRRDLEDPTHRFARKGASSLYDPGSKMWVRWVSNLSRSPWALAQETLALLEEKIGVFPGSASMLRDLRGRLAMDLRDSDTMTEKKKVFRFSKRVSFISEAYLEVLEGRPVRGLFFRTFEYFLKFVTMRVLEKELQEHRETLRGLSGEERLRLVEDWKHRFSPALDDFEIRFQTGKILLPKIHQGNGRLETVMAEATDEEILNALPLSHRGILRTILRVLDEEKNKTGIKFFADSGEAFYVKISKAGEKMKVDDSQLFEKLSLIQAELFRAQTRGDIRFRKPARIIKHVSNIYPFWIEETVRLATRGAIDSRLEKALIHWRYYLCILLPDDVKDPAQFDRMNRGLSALAKSIRKTDLGRHLFVSRHLVDLLSETPLLGAEEFVRRLESLPVGENYYASFYDREHVTGEHEETEEDVERRKMREEQRRLRDKKAAESRLARDQAFAAARDRQAMEQQVRQAKLAALEVARLEAEAASRAAQEAAMVVAAKARKEREERLRRTSWESVVKAQGPALLSLLAAIEDLIDSEYFSPRSNGFRTSEEILSDYGRICHRLEEAMNLPLSVQHAADSYAKAAKDLVEEARRMKRALKTAANGRYL